MKQQSSEADQSINALHAEENNAGSGGSIREVGGEGGWRRECGGEGEGVWAHIRCWLIYLIIIYSYWGTFQCALIIDEFLVKHYSNF